MVRRLFDEAQPLLLTLDRLLPAGNSVRDSAHDEVTETARECLLRLANTLGNWKGAAEVLELFSEIPIAESERTDFKKDLALFRDNAAHQGLTHNLKPIDSAPGLYMNNGFGVKLYGHADYDSNTRSYLATHYFVLLEIPVIPLARYRVSSEGDNTYRFYGKAPLRTFDKIHLAVLVLVPVILLSILVYYGGNYDVAWMARNRDFLGLASAAREAGTEARKDAASKALNGIVPNSKDDVDGLLAALKSDNQGERNAAAEVLQRIDLNFTRSEAGRAVIPLFVAALKDDGNEGITRDTAANTLGRFGPYAKDALPALEQTFKQTGSVAVLKAVWKIRPHTPESVSLVVTALKSTNATTRLAAVDTVDDIYPYFLQSEEGREITTTLATVATQHAEYDEKGKGTALHSGYDNAARNDSKARNGAEDILKKLGPAANSAIPVLEAALQNERRSQSAYGEETIIGLLNKIDPQGAKNRRVLSKRK